MSEKDLKKFDGKNVELKFKHFMGGVGRRVGWVEIEDGWLYVYDNGKTGQNYNGAFKMSENEILEIKEINNGIENKKAD